MGRACSREDPDGLWAGGVLPAAFTFASGEAGQPGRRRCTLQTLLVLGLDPDSESARRAVALVGQNGRWEHAGQPSSMVRSSPAATGGRSGPARTSAWTSRRSSTASSAKDSRTADGTARQRTDRCDRRSTRRSTCSTVCSRSSERPAAPTRYAPRVERVRSTCSSAACSAARAPASGKGDLSRAAPVLLALRRAAGARPFPGADAEPDPAWRKQSRWCGRSSNRRTLVARPHPSRSRPLRHRGRRPESLEIRFALRASIGGTPDGSALRR